MLRPLLLAGFALLVGLPASAAAPAWRTSWAAPPAMPMPAAPGVPPERATPQFRDQTIVQTIRLSGGGGRLRLRLSNEYGKTPLAIGHARIVRLDAEGKPIGAGAEVTFGGGARSALIPPHAPMFSDPVALAAPAAARLQVSLYLPGDAGPCTCHATGIEEAKVSAPGDWTDRPFTPASTTGMRAYLTAVETEAATVGPVIVTLGDSITDGFRSTTGADRRWPDRLAERLRAASLTAYIANAGLSGNRVLSDGVIPIFGESALTRFDRDVLGHVGVTHLVVLEGVNDVGGKPTPSADAMIAGYRQIIARGHAHGMKVILGTVLAYRGTAYFREDGEAVRAAVNAWIRSTREADGVIDFDLATRDPKEPSRMRADLQSGDWLHPNDAGYRAMGDAVPLGLFR